MDIAWCTCIPGSSLQYVLRSQHDIEEPESSSINQSGMEEDGKHEQEIEVDVEVEEDEIVNATYGETNKRPSTGSTNERNTVEGKKDHPANGPTKMSNDKLGRSRKAKDKGAAAVGVNSAGGATYCICYKNNQSKRWDGKELLVDKDWVDELYPDGIYPGNN